MDVSILNEKGPEQTILRLDSPLNMCVLVFKYECVWKVLICKTKDRKEETYFSLYPRHVYNILLYAFFLFHIHSNCKTSGISNANDSYRYSFDRLLVSNHKFNRLNTFESVLKLFA